MEPRFPRDLVKLTYSKHAKARLVERTTGVLILAPNYIRLSKENTVNVKVKDGRVVEAVVHIEYKKGIEMYLVIAVGTGVVKTIYFKDAKKKYETSQNKGNRNVQKIEIKPEVKISFREVGETGREREDVADIPRDLGGEEGGWKELLRIVRRILGGRTPNYLLRPRSGKRKREVETPEI